MRVTEDINLDNNKQIVLLGDIHGEYSVIEKFCENFSDTNIIQVGDFGIGFQQNKSKESRILKNICSFLKKSNNKLFVIRGNHDDPSYFDNRKIDDEITFLSDYSLLIKDNKRILCVGGGISIDRTLRKSGISWWEGEIFNLDPDKVVKSDVLITHVAPKDFPISKEETNPMVVNFSLDDKTLIQELKQEKNMVQQLSDLSQAKRHYFGHYHIAMNYPTNNRKYRCININEFLELKFE